jgi:hypothetical protein
MDEKRKKHQQNRVKVLLKKPQPVQRSRDWFDLRNTRITASDVSCCLTNTEEVCRPYIDEFKIEGFKIDGKCCSHFDTKEDFIIKKCKAFFGENVFKDSVYTLWGKKYEEIATRLYRIKYNTQVIEFGLLPHSRLTWLGASPDGITPDGIMLEIKCPYSRKINGVVPFHYWQQMQIQLETCDLDICHFLECEILELENEDQFMKYELQEGQEKGILINILDEVDNSEQKYIYPPDNLSTDNDFVNWSDTQITLQQPKIAKKVFWVITKWNVINVNRRKDWFEHVKPILKETHRYFRNLQERPVLFQNYEESIHLIKNKKFIEKYNQTTCLIHTELDEADEFVDLFDMEMEEQKCLL